MRITIEGIRLDILTGKRIEPHLWSSKQKKALGKSQRADLINKYMVWAENKVRKIHGDLTDEDGPALAFIIKNRFIIQGND